MKLLMQKYHGGLLTTGRGLPDIFRALASFSLLLAILQLYGCAATAPPPHPPPEISPEARCAVCGMFPARFPRWHSQLIMGDGRQVVFDSPREMFSYLGLLKRYDYAGKQGLGKGLAAVWVRDFQGGAWLDGQRAWYVVDSDQRGPMGPDIVPFGERPSAEAFVGEHGGRVLPYAEVEAIFQQKKAR